MIRTTIVIFAVICFALFLLWLTAPGPMPEPLPEIQITFPEGFTVQQIQERLEANNIKVFLDADLEGYLFPDTYRFYEDSSKEIVIQKMRKNFNKKVGKIDYNTLILASIVEKEVSKKEDLKKVAGIFLKRLKVNMPLQSDATVNFITGKNLTQPSIADTKTESLYNTYLHTGLPPAPICNPGLEAIKAVQNPEKTEYWYFLTPLNMETIYSKTLEQHNQAKAKFLTNKNKASTIQ